VKFLQIWLFPNKKNVQPRYDQMTLNPSDRRNTFQQIVSPNPDDQGVWIQQNAWFYLSKFDNNFQMDYKLKDSNHGVYGFVLQGEVNINGISLNQRDGLGLWDTEAVSIKAESQDAELLLMELPMSI
jgi:redox-sensitive bicupin YhaK (pirin superfamily)